MCDSQNIVPDSDPDEDISPKSRGIFYGWWIVAISTAASTIQSAVFNVGAQTLVLPLIREFDTTRTAISIAFSLRRLEGGVTGPLEGYLIHWMGPRPYMVVGWIIFGLGFIAMGLCQNIYQFYAAFLLVTLGQSVAGFLPIVTVLVNWFDHWRGRAIAIYQLGGSFGALLVPVLAWAVLNIGWRPTTISVGIIVMIVGSAALYNYTKKELLPLEDRGAYLVIGFTDEGSSFEYTQKRAIEVENRLVPLLKPEDSPYNRFLMIVPGFGSDNSFLIIALLDNWKNRKQNSQTVMRQAIGKIVTVPQAVAFPISPQSIRVSSYNKPVQMVIYGNTYEELEEVQSKVIRMLRKNRNLSRLESDFTKNKPEVKLEINKNKAKDLGISAQAVGQTLETLYGGKTVTKFNKLGKEYPIILQQYLEDRKDKESLSKIFVRSENSGSLISLSNLVDFKEVGSASKLSRYNRQRAVTISANISESYTLSEAIKYLENTMSQVAPDKQITWKGKSEELKETSNELYIIFALALLTAYLVMSATFNSFVHPFIIVLTVPLAVFGGLVFIQFLNTSINIFSQIALVILIGISTKNSILIVDYANQLRTTGKNIETAVREACDLRFRPIIMTSLSTMIAMMPLVIGNIGPGAGEGSRLAVGATILGGMVISTFFTLYVTPTMYLTLAKNTKRIDAVDIELKKQIN